MKRPRSLWVVERYWGGRWNPTALVSLSRHVARIKARDYRAQGAHVRVRRYTRAER